MKHIHAVCNKKRIRYDISYIKYIFLRKLSSSFLNEMFQIYPVKVFHCKVHCSVLIEKFVYIYNVRVAVKPGNHLGFLKKLVGTNFKIIFVLLAAHRYLGRSCIPMHKTARVVLLNRYNLRIDSIKSLVSNSESALAEHFTYTIPFLENGTDRENAGLRSVCRLLVSTILTGFCLNLPETIIAYLPAIVVHATTPPIFT